MAFPIGNGDLTMDAQTASSLRTCRSGFTLVELLVVMAIMATLLSIAAPRYITSLELAKESALRTNLRVLREAIDRHRGDTGRFPASLDQLVEARYLRAIPEDPVTDSRVTWIVVPHPDGVTLGVYDVRSAAPGVARDGSAFSAW